MHRYYDSMYIFNVLKRKTNFQIIQQFIGYENFCGRIGETKYHQIKRN